MAAEPLADVGPVFLFDMGVIVLMIGPASGELDGLLSLGNMSAEVMVEKLGSVATIEAEQGERQGDFNIFDLLQEVAFSFFPYGSLFSPAGGDTDAVDGIGEHTREGLSAMGDGVGFEEAGAGLVPLVGLDGDVFSKEGSWLGGGAASFLILGLDGAEESINGCC